MTQAQLTILQTLAEGGALWHSSGAVSSWSGKSAWLVPANRRLDARRVRYTTVGTLLDAGFITPDPSAYPDAGYRLTKAGKKALR